MKFASARTFVMRIVRTPFVPGGSIGTPSQVIELVVESPAPVETRRPCHTFGTPPVRKFTPVVPPTPATGQVVVVLPAVTPGTQGTA